MKAILSSTYDDQYLFNLPIVTWAWNKLGVEVELFLPNYNRDVVDPRKTELATMLNRIKNIHFFNCPPEKEATYAQNSRLYGACVVEDPEEVLIISDVDMLTFKPLMHYVTSEKSFGVLGRDLVPEGQLPMCYLWGAQAEWQSIMEIRNRGFQECLDAALAHENCEHMRANLWGRDQETIFNQIAKTDIPVLYYDRARPGTQFARARIDRDDSFWHERLDLSVLDAHLWRPLWEEANFQKLMTIMKYFWPTEDFTWIETYRQEYIKLL